MGRRKSNARRKDGRIEKQLFLGYDEDGKRKVKSVFGYTQTEVDAKLQELREELGKGSDISASEKPFSHYADKWLKRKMRADISHSWQNQCTFHAEYLSGKIGSKIIRTVTVDDLQGVVDELAELNPTTGKPASKRHIRCVLNFANQIFKQAIKDKALAYNPVTDVEIPKTPEPQKRRALTDAEQQWVLNTEHRAKRAAMIMMYAGLRRGELIPLTWTDIDLNAKTISINKTVENSNGVFAIKNSAKTDASIRIVDIPQRLVDYLRNEKRDSILVCVNAQGRMHTDTSWRRMWDSYLADINIKYGDFSPFQNKPKSKFDPGGVPFVIPRITPHWLRHTFCTLLYLSGVDILTTMRQMGHSNSKTTYDIYTHLDTIYKRKSMSKLDDFLSAQESYSSQIQVSTF